MAEIVIIKNVGPNDFIDGFDGDRYRIPAGEQVMISYDAMCLWLGHPKSNNYDPRNRVRVQEYHRLRTRYGVDAKGLELAKSGQMVDSDELFKAMKPTLECFDHEMNPILTVADDPDGNFLTPLDVSTPDTQAQIMARMQELEREIKSLQAAANANARKESALNDAQPIGVDNAEGYVEPTSTFVGTVEDTPGTDAPEPPRVAPRGPARTAPGEDTPTRVRVSGGTGG